MLKNLNFTLLGITFILSLFLGLQFINDNSLLSKNKKLEEFLSSEMTLPEIIKNNQILCTLDRDPLSKEEIKTCEEIKEVNVCTDKNGNDFLCKDSKDEYSLELKEPPILIN